MQAGPLGLWTNGLFNTSISRLALFFLLFSFLQKRASRLFFAFCIFILKLMGNFLSFSQKVDYPLKVDGFDLYLCKMNATVR